MTNRNQPESTQNDKKPTEQALLVEYQACQHEASASGSYGWQSGIIFFVTTLTLAGAVISYLINAETSLHRLLVITTLGIFSVIVLCAWKKYANRQRFIREIMYSSMRMIERKLNLRKNWYVHFLDNFPENATEDDWESEEWLPLDKAEREELWKNYRTHPGRKPQGFKWINRVAWVAIIAWVVLILVELGFFLLSQPWWRNV